jgi:hypothetical protein
MTYGSSRRWSRCVKQIGFELKPFSHKSCNEQISEQYQSGPIYNLHLLGMLHYTTSPKYMLLTTNRCLGTSFKKCHVYTHSLEITSATG